MTQIIKKDFVNEYMEIAVGACYVTCVNECIVCFMLYTFVGPNELIRT